MFDLIPKLFGPVPKTPANKDIVAELLRVDRTILEQFEKAYEKAVLRDEAGMVRNAKQASAAVRNRDFAMPAKEAGLADLIERIVEELLEGTVVLEVKDGQCRLIHPEYRSVTPVTNAEIMSLPESLRPQLTGSLLKKDVNGDGFEDIMMLLIKSDENALSPGRKHTGSGSCYLPDTRNEPEQHEPLAAGNCDSSMETRVFQDPGNTDRAGTDAAPAIVEAGVYGDDNDNDEDR